MSQYNQPPVGVPPAQGYPPEGYPKDAYPPQGYPPQGYPPQGHPQQGYPPPYAPQYPPPPQHQQQQNIVGFLEVWGEAKQCTEQAKNENSDLVGTEHGEILDVKGGVRNIEEGEMVNDVPPMMHITKRKMGSPPEKQSEGKRRHNSENSEEGHKTSRGSSHHGDREHRRHSQENNHS